MDFQPIPCHESLRPFIRNYWLLTVRCTATGTQQIFSNRAASQQFSGLMKKKIKIENLI